MSNNKDKEAIIAMKIDDSVRIQKDYKSLKLIGNVHVIGEVTGTENISV